MRLAVIGSRRLYVRDLGPYLPDNVTEIVSGGAKGIDGCAGEYARRNGILLMTMSSTCTFTPPTPARS